MNVFMFSYFVLLPIGCLSLGISKSDTQFKWVTTEEWSDCSVSCGDGVQQKRTACIEISLYSEKFVPDSACKDIPKLESVVKECNHGECEGYYMWHPTKWSECSQTCGGAGRKTRDIECVYSGSGNTVITESKYCDESLLPESSAPCNRINCPAHFVPGKWGKCEKARGCSPGKQKRSMTCESLLANGNLRKMPRPACSSGSRPPISWKRCFDHVNTKECLSNNTKKEPYIDVVKNTLVQMRRMKRLKIQVGEVAYTLPNTRLALVCPVHYFIPRDILWKHGQKAYQYHGKSKDKIRVDRKGKLLIKNVQSQDQGIWICVAGSSNASLVIKLRNPSSGYLDYKLRTPFWSRDMMSEDPQVGSQQHKVIHWVSSKWTSCSVTCGGKGYQSREVHCEQIENKYYIILNDEVCEKRGQKRPLNRKECVMSSKCPEWSLTEYDPSKCTDKCLSVGVAQVQGQLRCIHQGKELDFGACDKKQMPSIECKNEKCEVDWKKSEWSKCSRSCGGNGVRARYLICVWKLTEEPAGSLCFAEKLKIPTIMQPCTAPKCILKCVDLLRTCRYQAKACKKPFYKYQCCESCSKPMTSHRVRNAYVTTAVSKSSQSSLSSKLEKKESPTVISEPKVNGAQNTRLERKKMNQKQNKKNDQKILAKTSKEIQVVNKAHTKVPPKLYSTSPSIEVTNLQKIKSDATGTPVSPKQN